MKKFLLSFTIIICIFSFFPIKTLAEESDVDISIPEKCTAVYVGKDVSLENTRIIARSEDRLTSLLNKLYYVQESFDKSGRYLFDTGAGQKYFKVPIPEHTFKYLTMKDARGYNDGPYYSLCVNEKGVAITATITTEVSNEYSKIDPLKKIGDGIREAILPAIVGCQATSAKDAVEILAKYIDDYGSAEYNTCLISDKYEAWIFEIYGGYSYAAMKLPDDKVAVFGNQVMLEWIDFNNLDNFVVSKNLRTCLDKVKVKYKQNSSTYHISKTITGGKRWAYSNMRNWIGHRTFMPSSTSSRYYDHYFYSFLYTPEYKVSVLDVMRLYGNRFEGTYFDLRYSYNSGYRPIGTVRQNNIEIIQTIDSLPEETCHLVWTCMGNAEHCIFVPAFSGISETFEKYRIDNEYKTVLNDSFYNSCKKCASLAETNRDLFSSGLKNFNYEQEKIMLEKVMSYIPDIERMYYNNKAIGELFVTNLAIDMAQEQYNNVLSVYDQLLFTQIRNNNDSNTRYYFNYDKKIGEEFIKNLNNENIDLSTSNDNIASSHCAPLILISLIVSVIILLLLVILIFLYYRYKSKLLYKGDNLSFKNVIKSIFKKEYYVLYEEEKEL